MDNVKKDYLSSLQMPKSDFIAPIIYLGVFLILMGSLLFVIYYRTTKEQTTDIKIFTERIVKNIELKLNGNLDFLTLIAKERSEGYINEQTFQSHVNQYLLDHPEFINITWVDSNFIIKTVSPLEGNSHIIGLHLELSEPKKVSNLAKETKKSGYTKAFEAIQGQSSFEVWVPVFKGEKFLGLMAGVYSCSNLLKQSVPLNKKYMTNFSLQNDKDETLTVISELNPTDRSISFQSPLTFLKNGMKVNIEFRETQPFSLVIIALVFFCIILSISFLYSIWKIKREMQMRLESQESLKASEETYRMLFESINDAVLISEFSEDNKSLRFIKVNAIACKRLGYNEKELLAKSPFEINSLVSQPNIPNLVNKILKEKQAIIETEHVTKDGCVIPVEISTKVTQFGNKILLHSIARDITERKQNELRIKKQTDEIEAQNEEYQQINKELNQVNEELNAAKNRAEYSENNLKRKNEELRQTIQQLTDLENRLQFALMAGKLGTWDWDIQSGRIIWSDSSKLMSGIPLDADIDYSYFLSTVIPEDRDTINSLVSIALKEKKDYFSEYRVKWPDQSIHWIRVMGRGLYDDLGNPIRMIGIGMEITESKNAELALAHSHNLMSYIIQHNPSSIAVFDKKLKYIYVSQRYLDDFKISGLDIIGKYHYDIFPDLPQKYRDTHLRCLQGEILGEDEDSFYNSDGSRGWFSWECRPWYEADGTIGGIIIYSNQITDLIKQKQELIASKEKAEESDRLKTAFLQNMSHEIRTPMNAIMGFSSLLKNNFYNKGKLEKFSDIINQRGTDLLNIIDDILDIAKIESGQLPLNLQDCNLITLFEDLTNVFAEYKSRLGKQDIQFSLKCSFEEENKIIVTDPVKLKQVLINLITNAFKFTDSGRIDVGYMFISKGKVLFYVSDTGIGIPKDKQEVIFERFSQLNQNPKKNIGGTGLGLSIVKALVNLLGGEVFLESEPNQGSTFSFTISYIPGNGKLHKDPNPLITDQKETEEKTILIVEDDFFNAEYLKEILIELNFKIILVENGEKAVKIAASEPIDLILMDIRLPGKDGYTATKEIHKFKPDLKIIAQTAFASPDERQKAIDAGCHDYISKPTQKEALLTLINHL